MKRFSILILSLLLTVCVLGSCGSLFTPYEFYQSGMKITLDSSFSRVNAGEYTFCYTSSRAIVYGLKEEFGETLTEDTTLAEYADMILQANSLTAKVEEQNGYLSFVYEAEQVGVSYTYEVFLYQTDGAFWMVYFSCPTDSYANQKTDIETWAKSVVFS